MHLTPHQKRALLFYRWYHKKPPTLVWYFTIFIWRSAYLVHVNIFLVSILAILSHTLLVSGIAYSLLGLSFGFIIRDILAFRQTVLLWPTLDSIIDWSKVEILLNDSDQSY